MSLDASGGKLSFICDICEKEATYLTPDYQLCSECQDHYPIGSDEFYRMLDWVERYAG
ncbi:hypothetical protein NONO_c24590 [Nocardia nova SH22a]|uniref:Uncharacterized protein n=1 Tax=Nocardia nova SH22a TaxID=1415166 RepID=W5TD43_9NOCA|nr:hypothetical protein [Nocardia nova]AHH17255.1 hypothetical protein NONO_c24590 [Nocardia nova SH22a]